MSTLRNEQYTGMEETVRQFVLKRFGEKPELEKIWDTPIDPAKKLGRPGLNQEVKSRSVKGLVKYLYREARKLLQQGSECVAVDDTTVFGWINHYLEEEGDYEIIGMRNAEGPDEAEEAEEAQKQAKCEPETEAMKEKPQEVKPKPVEAKPEPKKRGRKPKPEPEGIGKQLMLFSL